MNEELKTIRLHPGQTTAIRSKSRFTAIIAGTGGGKTFTGPPWLYLEMAKNPGGSHLVLAPTYKILSRSTVPTLVEAFRGTDAEGELKETKGEYRVRRDGSTIYLLSADKPEGLESGQYRSAWLDEAGQMSSRAWTVVQARLGFYQGRALITTTPYNLQWLYHDFFKRWKNGDPDYFVVQFPSTMNPHYPREEYERMRNVLSAPIFHMRYDGVFEQSEGPVYPFIGSCQVRPREIPSGWERYGGIDFGFKNPFVALHGALDNDGVLWIYEEYYQTQRLLSEHTSFLNTETEIPYYADPSAAQEIEELVDMGVDVIGANNNKSMGILRVNSRIRSKRLKISTSCEHLIEEGSLYCYEERASGVERPVKRDDHTMDALRYLIMGIDDVSHPDIFSLSHLPQEKWREGSPSSPSLRRL